MDQPTQEVIDRIRRSALSPSAAEGAGVTLRQRGEIRFGPERRWMPYQAEQLLDPGRLIFRWRATVAMAPLMRAGVVDAFEDGHGLLEARMLGIPFIRARGPAVDKGECMRLLAELAWCPVGFGHTGLAWQAPDDRTLRVTYALRGLTATVFMHVDDVGQVTSVWADDRPRQVGKRAVPTRWVGRYADYRDFGGVRAPAMFAVDWEPPEGSFTYVRGTVEAVAARGPLVARPAGS